MNILSESLGTIFSSFTSFTSAFLPKFVAGLMLLFIGLIIASLLKDLVRIVFKYFRIEKWLLIAGIGQSTDLSIWPNLLGELVRWTAIFLFLMSAVDIWGIPKVADELQQLLAFIPNVFMVVIIGWAGLVAGRFVHDIVRHGVRGLGSHESVVLGNVARYVIIFFTVLIILTQLGVAAELVKILFTGIVGMLALSLGLAFGLGGKDHASRLLDNLSEKLKETSAKKIKK
ncbi:hypothetical protein HY029_05110 [Candidatus Gottesmanbacteria bacterium]|nr:hypothetical protein [Candidatus Gottesmanbacteria bacterium]